MQPAADLGAIIESSDDAIISKDLNGIILSWNGGAERLYGYTAADALGKPMTMLLPPDRANEEDNILEQLRNGERVSHFETTRVRKDGRKIHVSLTISPIRDDDGTIIGISHVARDITERKYFEEHLRQTQRFESLGMLAGGIANDFNNLLIGVTGHASISAELLPPSSPVQMHLREIILAGQRLSDLTHQLLSYSGRGTLSISPLNLSDVVREIAALIQSSVPKHVQVRLQLDDQLPMIHADVNQMQQIVMNLIINGAEAIPADTEGSVLVTTAVQTVDESYLESVRHPADIHPGEYVMLEVQDTGIGMDSETQARIFDPFFTTKFSGRGLGLAAALGIIQSHRGAIQVYTEPGKGATFKVLLPVAEGKPERPRSSLRVDLRGRGLILVVDDEEVVRRVATSALEMYGYSVITAKDGREAIHIFAQRAGEIDLVILDLVMPRMAGEETFRELRLQRPDVAVILSSGYNDDQARERFHEKSLAGFLRKPYTSVQLGKEVKRVLKSRRRR
jgi:two-component system cell cycle sensor histidine kinase/response regulator CckA